MVLYHLSNSKLAEIEIISVSGSEFILKGSQTGLFVSNAARRLRVTHDKESATKFSEELIESNQYSKYKIANSNCFLTVRKNGKTQISCKENQSNSITFYEQKKLKVSGLKNDYYYAHNCLKQLQKIKAIN